jgi:hypothetical protein
MTGPDLYAMLATLHAHPSLPAHDREALEPAFRLLPLTEVIPLQESVIERVLKVHAELVEKE